MQRLLRTRSTSLVSAFKGTISSESRFCRANRIDEMFRSSDAGSAGSGVIASSLYLLRVLGQQVVQLAGVFQPQHRHLHVTVVFLQVETLVRKQ